MDAKIQKQIIDHFTYFEEFYSASKTCLKNCQKCAVTINKLIVRCNNIKVAELNGTPLEIFEGLQNKLCAKIHNLISEEVLQIRSHLSTIEELFDKLCNKHKVLQESCKEIDFSQETPLVKGTPLQPPLKQVLEFADDTLTFGSQVCAQIETSLDILIFKGLKTEPLVENFKISSNWLRRVPEIIAYTAFCTENQI